MSGISTGTYNRVTDTGSGASPNLTTYYQELPADQYTVGLWHMNESSGSSVSDSSGNSNTGTATGTSIVNGVIGNARSFNGSSDKITLPSINASTNFTIEGWIQTSSAGTQPLFSNRAGSPNWSVYFGTTTGKIFLYVNGAASPSITGTRSINDSNWHHIAWTSDSINSILYVDGTIDTQAAQARTPVSNTGSIGWDSPNGNFFSGNIDDVRISNVTRSAEEIRLDAQRRPYSVYTSDVIDLAGAPNSWNNLSWTELGVGTGDGQTLYSSTNLVAQWNFDDASGTNATNSAGTCGTSCNGTLTSFTTTSGNDAAAGSGWTTANARWPASSPQALMFNGSSNYVNVTDNTNLAMTSAISVESWIFPSVIFGGASIVNRRTTGNVGGFSLELAPSNTIGFYVYISGSWYVATSPANSVNLNQWSHVVGTYDGSTIKIYINGVLQASTSISGTINNPTTPNVWIGRNIASTSVYYTGVIDSTRIYSRALTASEILSNYNMTNAEFQTRVGNSTDPNDGSWESLCPALLPHPRQ